MEFQDRTCQFLLLLPPPCQAITRGGEEAVWCREMQVKKKRRRFPSYSAIFFSPRHKQEGWSFLSLICFFFISSLCFLTFLCFFFLLGQSFFLSSFPFKLINSMLSLHELYNSHMIRGQDSQKHIVEIFI